MSLFFFFFFNSATWDIFLKLSSIVLFFSFGSHFKFLSSLSYSPKVPFFIASFSLMDAISSVYVCLIELNWSLGDYMIITKPGRKIVNGYQILTSPREWHPCPSEWGCLLALSLLSPQHWYHVWARWSSSNCMVLAMGSDLQLSPCHQKKEVIVLFPTPRPTWGSHNSQQHISKSELFLTLKNMYGGSDNPV